MNSVMLQVETGARRRVMGVIVVACFMCSLMSSGVHGAGERLLWEDRFHLGNASFNQAFAVTTLNERVFVSGYVRKPRSQFPTSTRDFTVRAYDRHTGSLLWQDTVDKGGDDFAAGIATDGKRIFVSGNGSIPGHGHDWLVRAYDPATGALVWENFTDHAGGDDLSRGAALAVDDGLVFVGGSAHNAQGNLDALVRAYDKSSGRIVWQDVVDYGGDFGDLATSLSVDEHRLFVAGTAATTTSVGYFVRAYDAKTGELLWERNSVENNPELFIFTTARVVAHGNRVFVGVSLGSELPISGFVYAFDARTGKLAWQDEIRTGGDADLIAGLATADGRVFAVADGGKQCLNDASPPSNCNTVVRAYHAEKGKLLWEQEFDLSGVDDFATGITAEGNNVYLSLTGGPATFPLGDAMGVWQVRALDASNGRLRWEHVVPSDVTIGDAERALDLASQDGELFVVGRTLFDFGCCDFTVRAYNTNP